MFTGIITAIGTMRAVAESDGGRELTIELPWNDIGLGESIAVDGACLTVAGTGSGWIATHVVATSLERTLFVNYAAGRHVNLERAVRASDRLGGHIVQGHVDGAGTVESVRTRDDARIMVIQVPATVASVSIPLGSIAVDGVSLTIDAVPAPGMVQVSVIPFTLQHTTLGERKRSDRVHLEGDMVGKYVQHFWSAWRAAEES